jgi:hypothetical protein
MTFSRVLRSIGGPYMSIASTKLREARAEANLIVLAGDGSARIEMFCQPLSRLPEETLPLGVEPKLAQSESSRHTHGLTSFVHSISYIEVASHALTARIVSPNAVRN